MDKQGLLHTYVKFKSVLELESLQLNISAAYSCGKLADVTALARREMVACDQYELLPL